MELTSSPALSQVRRRALVLAVAAFIVLVLAGAAAYVYFTAHPALAQKVTLYVVKYMIPKHLLGERGWALFAGIFANNAVSTLVTILVGIVPFLFLPLVNPLLNGGVIGLTAAVARLGGFSLSRFFLAGIAPHGIIELAAVCYAAGLGLSLAAEMVRKIVKPGSPDSPPFPALLLGILRSWALVVVPFLLVAAAIEAFITPHLLGMS
jgi:stage II sporulation protein M